MLKKVLHKRKIKNYSKQIFSLILLFIATLSVLCVTYIVFLSSKHRLASPLALLENTLHNASSNKDTKKIQTLLEKNAIVFSEITPTENYTTLVTLKDGQEVIIANAKDLEQQIASLQLIMRQLTIEGKRFNRIDFRFDNPIVTF